MDTVSRLAEMQQVLIEVTQISEADAHRFSSIFSSAHLIKGELFIAAGETGKRVAFVNEGLLRSYYISSKGEEFNKYFFVAGTFVAPLTSLVTHEPSSVHIDALEDTALLTANWHDLMEVYSKYPALNRVGRILVEYAWIGKERRETQLIMLNASERYRAFREEHPGLEQRIPQYHIASYLGVTPVQLSRIRAQGKRAPLT